MFRKKTYFSVEFLPDDQVIFNFQINKNSNGKQISNFFNEFLGRKHLEFLLKSIMETANKNNINELGDDICNDIINVQTKLEIKPIIRGRNPIIKPSLVMQQFGGEENE